MTTNKRLPLIISIGMLAALAIVELPHAKHYRQTALVEQLDVTAMSARANAVVTGTVTKQLGTIREMDATGEDMVYTRWRITPDKQLKGSMNKPFIVRTLGGQYLTTIVDAEDQPTFSIGERIIVFLQQIPEWKGDYRVVGEFQGKFKLEDRNGQQIAIQSETKKEQPENDLEQTVNATLKEIVN